VDDLAPTLEHARGEEQDRLLTAFGQLASIEGTAFALADLEERMADPANRAVVLGPGLCLVPSPSRVWPSDRSRS